MLLWRPGASQPDSSRDCHMPEPDLTSTRSGPLYPYLRRTTPVLDCTRAVLQCCGARSAASPLNVIIFSRVFLTFLCLFLLPVCVWSARRLRYVREIESYR